MLQNHTGLLRVANKAGGKCHRPSSVLGQSALHDKLDLYHKHCCHTGKIRKIRQLAVSATIAGAC